LSGILFHNLALFMLGVIVRMLLYDLRNGNSNARFCFWRVFILLPG